MAILAANGVNGVAARRIYAALLEAGAQPRIVGQRLGEAHSSNDEALDIEVTVEATPSVMYDAVVIAPGSAAVAALARDGRVLEFLRDAYRHDKPILALGAGRQLVTAANLPTTLPDGAPDPGLIQADTGELAAALDAFEAALAQHKVYARETDPPRV